MIRLNSLVSNLRTEGKAIRTCITIYPSFILFFCRRPLWVGTSHISRPMAQHLSSGQQSKIMEGSEFEKHYTNRSGWLRAAILGAKDGILSTTSLVIGVAAASSTRGPVVLAAMARLVLCLYVVPDSSIQDSFLLFFK